MTTGSRLYPNLYTFLVGPPGVGKSRAIKTAVGLLRQMPEPHIAPTSVTMASLVDHMVESKRVIVQLHNKQAALEYNSILIAADELSAFMHEYNGELIAGLTTFYDTDQPYGQGRRVKDIRIMIKNPQLNIISGTTPRKLHDFIPDTAWDDGFTSRIIMIYSDEVIKIDIFKTARSDMPPEFIHDLKIINSIAGEFGWTEAYAKAMNNWKDLGFDPLPRHPKLQHYCTRREAHMLKLSMIANVDRGSDQILDVPDFNKAMGWLLEAEATMPFIFKEGKGGADNRAMEEILHFINQHKEGVGEHHITNFARKHIEHAYNVVNVLNLMERSGIIRAVSHDRKTGLRIFKGATLN